MTSLLICGRGNRLALLDPEGLHAADLDAIATQITLEGSLIIRMHEYDPFRTLLHACLAGYALLGVDVVGVSLILVDSPYRTHLCAGATLLAGLDFECARLGKVWDDADSGFLGIVLSEEVEGTGQLASPAAATPRTVCV